MKPSKFGGREYRVLAVAFVFFFIGLFFFLRDSATPSPSSPSAVRPSVLVTAPVQSAPAGETLIPEFANDPAPSQFHTFTYSATGLNGSSSLVVRATCHDAYVALLIFSAGVDYRVDPSRAVFNVASPCASGTAFATVLHPSDLGGAPFGTYYFFTADQGTTGTWYNPK